MQANIRILLCLNRNLVLIAAEVTQDREIDGDLGLVYDFEKLVASRSANIVSRSIAEFICIEKTDAVLDLRECKNFRGGSLDCRA